MNQDVEHLRLLSIFHYILAGILALVSCFPLIHVTLGFFLLLAPQAFGHGQGAPPAFVGILFILLGGLFILFGWTLSVLVFLAGKKLQQRRHYTFCLVVAAVICMFMPFGTVLGVFTIIVLNRPTVKALFSSKVSFA